MVAVTAGNSLSLFVQEVFFDLGIVSLGSIRRGKPFVKFSRRVKNLWQGLARRLLVLLVAFSGCALQHGDDGLARTRRELRDLRSKVAELDNRIDRRTYAQRLDEPQSRLDQLTRPTDNDSRQIQDLRNSLSILRSELRGQDDRAQIAALTTQVYDA